MAFLALTFHFNITMRLFHINALYMKHILNYSESISNYSEVKHTIYRFLIEIFFYIDFNILDMKKIKND